ncbi:hypothetical protein RDI58_024578 [Solanum bulbocastanum]|uniref:R13L1/DRL21-like LRR repeat region domain-containing protein n=1 Tax=Solanum bulbocastanum TaxID=147425 RepID=A0AAN8SXX7_SOLBU
MIIGIFCALEEREKMKAKTKKERRKMTKSFLSLSECLISDKRKGSHMLEKSCPLSYSIGYDGEFDKLTPLYKLEQLRTLLLICIDVNYCSLSKRVQHNILPRLRSLRALSLSSYRIKELPNNLLIKLKLLKFFDLSLTYIGKLPDSICGLYNLETLLLSSCSYLKELPLQIENGLGMEDLGEAKNLYGSLSVVELQNVVDGREAVKAKMREKNHVEELSLEWNKSSSADNSKTERDILDEGTTFPNWLADPLFLKLVKLSLSNCKDCYSLPALGQLPSLKYLIIREMHGITEVTEEFYGISGCPKVGVVFDDAELFRSQIEGIKQIEELQIVGASRWGHVDYVGGLIIEVKYHPENLPLPLNGVS